MNSAENPSEPIYPRVAPDAPPVLAQPSTGRKLLAVLLSVFLGSFVLTALASVADDSVVLLTGTHVLTVISGSLSLLNLLLAILVYGLMALTPMVPKRVFVPVVFLVWAPILVILPAVIFCYGRLVQVDWLVSFFDLITGVILICWLHRGWKWRWPLVPVEQLGRKAFGWLNLIVFVLVNLLVIFPAIAAYSIGCLSLAVSHYTAGFVSVRPGGIVMQARKYARDDGKTVLLFPMSHVAESEFYRSVSQSVDTNAVVLLEGVTDTNNLLVHKISYQRAAKSLHLAEQHEDFVLNQGKLVHADVDVSEFSTNTLTLLNMVSILHTQGINAQTLSQLMSYAPTPEMEEQLLNDLLQHRNQHVLGVFNERLPGADHFVIPWGAAHMPGLSRDILKSGFHLVETHDYISIRFGGNKTPAPAPAKADAPKTP